MRPKHLYYRTQNDMVSVWNRDTCVILWRLEKSNIMDALHSASGRLAEFVVRGSQETSVACCSGLAERQCLSLLAKFAADVQLLPEVKAFAKR